MLEIRELTKRFGDDIAVDHVSFEVPAGQMTGFVGANGAGKTTTMRMIMGVLGIDEGEVLWQGRPITRLDRRSFGYMPEERGLWESAPRTTWRSSRWATSSGSRSSRPCCRDRSPSSSTSRSPGWTRWPSTRWSICCATTPATGSGCCSRAISSTWSSACATGWSC